MEFRTAFTPVVVATGVCFASLILWQLWPEMPQASAAAAPVTEGAHDRAGESVAAIRPIPAATGLDLRKVALGRRLFQERRLSRNDTISCATCHGLSTAGVDGLPQSIGIGRRVGTRNAPTVFNACLNYRQFWDGRAATLEEQIDGPLQARSEMSSDWQEVTQKLGCDAGYKRAFLSLYPEGIQPRTIKDAIATFERSLVTPDAPFDAYLRGDVHAISAQAREGYRLFTDYGCVACHQGGNVGGNLMQPFGVMLDPAAIRNASQRGGRLLRLSDIEAGASHGHGELYRVPSLRNVARTAPYFHNGSEKTLSGAIQMMGMSQLGRRLTDPDVTAIQAFLKSLTGRYEGKSL